MVATGLAATLIPIGFFAGACYVVYKLPKMLAEGDTGFLNAFRFLFFRFRTGAHWFIIVFLLRNLIISLVPAIGNQVIQILLLECIMIPLLVLTVYTMPWGVFMANVLDASNTIFLCILLIVFALFTDDVDGKLLAQICVVIVIGAFCGILAAVGWGIYERFVRSGKPFQFFICHHKAGAGNFTRLLKMILQSNSGVVRKVFLDSDDLRDLGTLFGTVSSDLETLVVLLSKEILLRPWCMGEVSTAYANKIQVVTVLFPGFEYPEDSFLERYEEHVPDANMLSGHGISLDLLKTALRWLQSRTTIALPHDMSNSLMKELADTLVKTQRSKKIDGQHLALGQDAAMALTTERHAGSKFSNYILANTANWESQCTALVLQRLLAPLMSSEPQEIPQVFKDSSDDLAPSCKQLCLICDTAIFRSPLAVNILLQAAKQDIAVLPVVSEATFRFPTPQYLTEIAATAEEFLKQAEAEYTGAQFARVVNRIFKEIAVELNPQDAELALKMRSQAIHNRLKGSLRKLGIDLDSTDSAWLKDAVDRGSDELHWDVSDLESYLTLSPPSNTVCSTGPRMGPARA